MRIRGYTHLLMPTCGGEATPKAKLLVLLEDLQVVPHMRRSGSAGEATEVQSMRAEALLAACACPLGQEQLEDAFQSEVDHLAVRLLAELSGVDRALGAATDVHAP